MNERGLRRVLGIWSVVAFGVTNEIAAGLFFVSTQIQVTTPGIGDLVPWLMIAGGALTFLTVIAYRYFFASGLVGAGGEYVILSRAMNPQVAFLATFLAWFGLTGAMGTLAFAAAGTFLANACSAAGWLAAAHFLSSPAGTVIVGLALIWIVYAIHVRGVRLASILTVTAMCFVIAVAFVVIGYGFGTTHDAFMSALSGRLHLAPHDVFAAAPVTAVDPKQIWTALPLLFFGYLGLSTATQTGGEAVDAQRSLSRGVVIAVSIVTAIYTSFAFAVYHAVPWTAIPGLNALKQTTYTTSTGLLGLVMPPWLASLMNVFVAVIVVKTFLPYFLAQSRWLFAWGNDGFIHRAFSRTHARFDTPIFALTMSAVLGSLSLFESTLMGYVFGVNVRVLSAMLVFFLMGLALLAFPKTAPDLYASNTSSIARKRPLQIAVGAAIMLFSSWFAVSIVTSSIGKPFYLQPLVQSAVVLAIGAVIVLARPRERSA